MRDFRDAKAMAQTLREALKTKSVSLTHAESLELVAKTLGFHDWNVLSARIQSEHQRPVTEAAQPPIAATMVGKNLRRGERLPTMPLRDLVLFPKMTVPLFAGREGSIRAVERAMAGDQRILVVTQRRAADDNPSPQDLYRVGVTASVVEQATLPDGTVKLLVKGLERATIVQLAKGQFLTAEVAPVEETRGQDAEAFDLLSAVFAEFIAYSRSRPYPTSFHFAPIREPSVLADALAPLIQVGIDQRQDLLETSDVIARLEKILAVMKAERQAA